jgi:hypothetical protein
MSLKVLLTEEIAMCLRMTPRKPKLRISVMAVKTCSKAFLAHCSGHGKSPCFSQVIFLQLVGPDYPLLILHSVDGAKNMECAL